MDECWNFSERKCNLYSSNGKHGFCNLWWLSLFQRYRPLHGINFHNFERLQKKAPLTLKAKVWKRRNKFCAKSAQTIHIACLSVSLRRSLLCFCWNVQHNFEIFHHYAFSLPSHEDWLVLSQVGTHKSYWLIMSWECIHIYKQPYYISMYSHLCFNMCSC